MSFCASCGRQRDGTSRFCGTCGTEFADSPASSDDQESSQADAAPLPDLTRIQPPADQPDPFASWYKPQGARNGDGATWQPTDTVLATPPQPTGYTQSPSTSANPFTPANPFSSANPITPPAPPFPPAPPAGPPAQGGRRGPFIALAVIVVLAAGGGAYALATTLGKHSSAQPPAQPTVSASAPASGSPTAGTTQQASSPATSASATPSPTLSLVSIAPGVTASAAEPQVETLLSHYFHGINTHSYAEYVGTLNPTEQAKQTQTEFNSGYSSTSDSGMTLTALSNSGNGGLTATVTFTSRQSPAQSVDKSACNAWTLNLYLVPQGNGYLIGPAPSTYQPTHSDC
jgi:hypothetical protein